jgi:hypothetical protein
LSLYHRNLQPVVAWRFQRDAEPIPDWVFEAHGQNRLRFDRWTSPDPLITVSGRFTLSARLGDWIVKDETGAIQVWSDSMFGQTFRKVEPA